MGHNDRFLPPRLSVGSGLGNETFAGPHGNEEDAPIPVIRGTGIEAGVKTIAVI